jgi:hypothetical protein
MRALTRSGSLTCAAFLFMASFTWRLLPWAVVVVGTMTAVTASSSARPSRFLRRTNEPRLSLAVPGNDLCEDAIPLDADDYILGTTVGATSRGEVACGTASASNHADVWYRVVGNGRKITAKTCTGDFTGLPYFDTQISVFSGTCDDLTCVTGNNDLPSNHTSPPLCPARASELSWDSISGKLYYILIHGRRGETGAFDLKISSRPRNDFCENAERFEPGDLVDGTLVGAGIRGDMPCGTASPNSFADVWYTVVGNGQTIAASTCFGEIPTEFDTQISVYAGTCDALMCVTGNNDNPLPPGTISFCSANEAAVTWDSTNGLVYYVRVHNFGTETGSFTLSTSSWPTPSTDNTVSSDSHDIQNRMI